MTFTEPKAFSLLTLTEKETVFEYIKDIALTETKDLAAVNMWSPDWENDPKTLMYTLRKTDLLSGDNGEYYVMFDELGDIACSVGVYRSEFDRSFGMATRLWVTKKYRHLKLGGITVSAGIKEWGLAHNCKACGASFNTYNKNAIVMAKRQGLGGKAKSLDKKNLFYNGMHEVEFPVMIKHTKQWVIYEKLDPSYEFDWESIRAKD